MKIAFVGNIANNFFREAKALQCSSKISADLYFVHNSNDNTVLPESDEPSLRDNYPDWIMKYCGFKTSKFAILGFMVGFNLLLKIQNKEIVDKLNNYDLCVLSGPDAVLIPFLNTTTVFRATGSDFTVFPLFSYSDFADLYQKKHQPNCLLFLKELVLWYCRKRLFRKSIQCATFVDTGFGKPFDDAAMKLNINHDKIINIFMLGIDHDVFSKRSSNAEICLKWSLSSNCFYVFMPSRIMIKSTVALKKSGQWKASDVAIVGFKQFIDKLDAKDKSRVKLLIPDRSLPTDLLIAKDIITELNIVDSVVYLSGEERQGLTRNEMLDIYSISSAVMDDFGAGWYGSVAVEALSCGVPLVTYVPEELMQRMFPWHPIQIAKTAEEIANCLYRIFIDADYARRVQEDSRRWVQEFHSLDATRKRLETGLVQLASSEKM